MNLFELFVKIGVDDQASGKLSKLSSSLGKGLATAAKIGTAAVGAAASGITALTTAAVNNYAEYEQLVGGVDTLFKSSSKKVQEYAANAYKTAGMSANEYMSTVTSFSASLLQSLGGDTDKAAEYANQALTDMSDNANKMGTSMEMIQNAYQGFAKQNYTMLDNLKLGYGGTKTEMERLIADAAKLDSSIQANDLSFGNIVKAINVVQTEMGITGTTAKEAGSTIQGSVGMMKSAWQNLVTGIADENANLDVLLTNLVDSVGTVAENLIPKIEVALGSIASLIEKLAPVIVEALPSLVSTLVPSLISAATGMVDAVIKVVPDLLNTVVDAIIDNAPALIDSAIVLIGELSNGILNMLPQIVNLGLDLIVSLANGITQSLPSLLPAVINVIMELARMLTDPTTLTNILNAAMLLIQELSYGLIDAIPQLVQAALMIIENLCMFLLDPQNLATLLKMAFDIIVGIGTGLINAIPELLKSVTRIIAGIVALFKDADWGKIGKDLVDGFKNGISKAWISLQKWFKNLFGDLIGIAKKILGIASPSKVFKKIGGFTAEGFGAGFEDEFAHVKDDMEDALNFDDASVGINASIRKVGAGAAGGAFGGTSIGNITINIDGAKYSDEQSLASAIALEIQNMTDRRAAVYA